MSTGQVSSHRSRSSSSNFARTANSIPPPPPSLTPENIERELEPCAATASYLLYAQQNIVLCLHHDTLAIERRFDRHREDIRWIAADTVSERGAGRLAVSYDAGHTAIVWDIATGDEIARFAAYEEIRVATWMRNGNIAFGNVQGNVILFEPSTSEHISARTIYDPITAIAPVADNRTFAIGYLNGSILIATLQPFTMIHSLNTSSAPSRITDLAWHGSASRQKSDMLATQTADGNLKVWSIPKVANGESPNIIRILNKPDGKQPGPCWFAWSKLGRIVQYSGGETRSWDVRTKNVTFEIIPTSENIIGIANYGPTSTLFTLGHNNTVQQYDMTPGNKPLQVASAHQAPADTPPSPPNSIEEQRGQGPEAIATLPTLASIPVVYSDAETSENEDPPMSPLQRIAKEMDQLEEESRDRVGPLSPVSSRASSVSSSRSSGTGRRAPSYRYDKPPSSRASNASANEGTEFSFGQPIRQPVRESISTRSTTSSKYRSSGLRKEVLRSPEESRQGPFFDMFPFVKARLANVPFRTPHYGQMARTPDVLRREMLSVVFGWNDDIDSLIRDELSRHPLASTCGVLLAQWLGELGADSMASMVGSESMTSSDWMLLALSTMGHASQKKVGEAFVHRLLEKGDIHPAVAVLLGLGEENDAIEVYVSRDHYMEAILLTCLVSPSDWQRQSYLVRKWGEILVAQGQPELAVRCFSCTSVDISEPWASPRAQDSVFAARNDMFGQPVSSPLLSPPSATDSGRLRSRNSSLKLITTFGDKGAPVLPHSSENTPMANMLGVGVTPIAESAISPGGVAPWLRSTQREPSSARTATPGGYARKRYPSRSGGSRARVATETPITASRDFVSSKPFEQSLTTHVRRTSSISSSETPLRLDPTYANRSGRDNSNTERLPSPTQDVFARLRDDPKSRNGSRERLPINLQVQVYDTSYFGSAASPATSAVSSNIGHSNVQISRPNDRQAGGQGQEKRDKSRQREASENRGRKGTRYIRPAKPSPSSPVPMSPEEVAAATRALAKERSERSMMQQDLEPVPKPRRDVSRAASRAPSQQRNHGGGDIRPGNRGRSQQRMLGSAARSPSSPLSMSRDAVSPTADEHREYEGQQVRSTERSSSRQPREQVLPREVKSPVYSQRGAPPRSGFAAEDFAEEPNEDYSQSPRDQGSLVRKRLAARELEERRASLARRPSAPVIPLPGEAANKRPPMAPRFHTELGDSPQSTSPSKAGTMHGRSHTADPHDITRFLPRLSGAPGPGQPAPIGLPATPRAMRHPYNYANMKHNDSVPAVPDMPDTLEYGNEQSVQADADSATPLLPSTVFSFNSSPQALPRAASVPLERSERNAEMILGNGVYKAASPSPSKRRASVTHGHNRQTSKVDGQLATDQHSPQPVTASIDETLHDTHVVVVEPTDSDDVFLPELIHLATPPPPPPPPPPMFSTSPNTSSSSLGVINIAIEEDAPMIIDVGPTVDRAATTSPSSVMSSSRRGRGSVSEGLGSRLRNVTDRMRSTSRSRAKTPTDSYKPMPYETILPPIAARRESISRAKLPYEISSSSSGGTPVMTDAAAYYQQQHQLDKAVAPEDISLPPSRAGSAFQPNSNRNPREIRANMPPPASQQGVYPSNNMI